MIRPRPHKPIAWLAFAAMWLLVAAPPVSQMLLAAPDGAMHCDEHAGHAGDALPHAPSLSKCGYCDLLGHSPILGSVAWLAPIAPTSAQRSMSLPPVWRATRVLLSAAPRGPPAGVNA